MGRDAWTDRIGTWADKALAVFAPRRAAVRGHFRRFERDADYRDLVITALNTYGYRAAKGGRNTPWLGGNRSADAEIIDQLPHLFQKSREINRDDPIGSGLTGTFVDDVIGVGMAPQARTDDEDLNRLIEAAFRQRQNRLFLADDLDFGAGQRLIFRKVFEDGGVLLKRAKREPDEPVWFEVIEKDRLGTPLDAKPEDPQGRIADGVEKDAAGVPLAYWVAKQHPGDRAKSLPMLTTEAFTRVPRGEARYLRLIERPGQTHGVPAFHAILQDLRDLDLLLLAALKRTQVAACLAAFIKTEGSLDNILNLTAEKYGYRLDQTLEPGMMWRLYPNESIETMVPNFPTPELSPFVVMLARRIGSALGVSWQIVLKDFSDSTYSSARTDQLEARKRYGVLQRWFTGAVLDWLWFSVLEDARLMGDPRVARLDSKSLTAVYWIPNGWRWIDPLKEATATEVELRAGITNLRDVCASQGKDWEETLRQRLREEKFEADERAKLGLPPKQAADDTSQALVTALLTAEDAKGNGSGKGRRTFADRTGGIRT